LKSENLSPEYGRRPRSEVVKKWGQAPRWTTIQEIITLTVFCVFAVFYLKEPLRWNYVVGFALIAGGALFVFAPGQAAR